MLQYNVHIIAAISVNCNRNCIHPGNFGIPHKHAICQLFNKSKAIALCSKIRSHLYIV